MTFIDSHRWFWVVGSVAGRGHRRVGRGSQDAVCVRRAAGGVVAVVCDGCSAGAGSAVGAGVGARLVAAEVARLLEQPGGLAPDAVLDALPGRVLAALVDELARLSARWAVGDDDAVIADALLFTVQVAVLTERGGIVFGVGDGRVRVDGDDVVVGGVSDGAPDCPAYALLPGLAAHATLRVHRRFTADDTARLQTLLIGSDGALELGDDVIDALGRDDALVLNPSLATKRLLAGPGTEDDCTVVVLRRAPLTPSAKAGPEVPCA
jgi:hypothetical protein